MRIDWFNVAFGLYFIWMGINYGKVKDTDENWIYNVSLWFYMDPYSIRPLLNEAGGFIIAFLTIIIPLIVLLWMNTEQLIENNFITST
jgi:hypothetical protein